MNSFLTLKEIPSLKVHCNWESNIPEKFVDDSIMIQYDDKENKVNQNLNEIVAVKTTVGFICPENCDDKPVLSFEVPTQKNIYVSSIVLLCDAKAIEVFGNHHIYLDTFHSIIIEESDEFHVYEISIDFKGIVNKEISLKFLKLTRSNSLWIYGVLLKLKKCNQVTTSINYDNVQEMLKNCQLSDQASRTFNFVKNANTSLAPKFANCSEESSYKLKDDGQLAAEVKGYIDHKFQVLTEYLIMREKNLNDKMDRIIELLKVQK